MRKQIIAIVALLMMVGVASAQQSKSDETLEFRPHWSLRFQGGAAYTVGGAPFGKLISPAAQISVAYDFHHAMGVRVGFSGFQGKGGVTDSEDIYGFRFAQLNADYVLDLAGIIRGFKHDRLVSPYVFAGIGGAYGFDNVEATQLKVKHQELDQVWDSRAFFAGRAGLGADLWLTENLSLGLELNANYYGDKFNSNTADNGDWQLNSLLGMKLRFGGNTAPSKAYLAAQEAAAAEAAALAALKKAEAEKLAAEKAAAEKAAVEKAEAERLAAEKAAAAAKEAAEKAAAERAALAAENSKDIFFKIGSHEILKPGQKKLEALAEFMKTHEDYTLLVVGYADKATGTDAVNMKVSKRRAEAVKKALVDMGVAESRITVTYKGATVQPFEEIVKNRVAICTLQ